MHTNLTIQVILHSSGDTEKQINEILDEQLSDVHIFWIDSISPLFLGAKHKDYSVIHSGSQNYIVPMKLIDLKKTIEGTKD